MNTFIKRRFARLAVALFVFWIESLLRISARKNYRLT